MFIADQKKEQNVNQSQSFLPKITAIFEGMLFFSVNRNQQAYQQRAESQRANLNLMLWLSPSPYWVSLWSPKISKVQFASPGLTKIHSLVIFIQMLGRTRIYKSVNQEHNMGMGPMSNFQRECFPHSQVSSPFYPSHCQHFCTLGHPPSLTLLPVFHCQKLWTLGSRSLVQWLRD